MCRESRANFGSIEVRSGGTAVPSDQKSSDEADTESKRWNREKNIELSSESLQVQWYLPKKQRESTQAKLNLANEGNTFIETKHATCQR